MTVQGAENHYPTVLCERRMLHRHTLVKKQTAAETHLTCLSVLATAIQIRIAVFISTSKIQIPRPRLTDNIVNIFAILRQCSVRPEAHQLLAASLYLEHNP